MSDVQNLTPELASAVLREGFIGRQMQNGTLEPTQIEQIKMGKQDQSIGFDDAKFALENASVVWGKAQQSLGGQT